MSAIFGETLRFDQENGSPVELVVFGDEFYARYETRDGFSVVYDVDLGRYAYAMLVNGRFASSGTPISKPPPREIRRHLRESPDVRNAKFERRYERCRPRHAPAASHVAHAFGPNEGLLEGRRASEGDVRGLTILVQFADVTTDVTAADVSEMLNGDDYHVNGNFCSVRGYFELVSAGKLHYTNDVVGPITLPHDRRHYQSNLLVPEALEIAVAQFGVDLSRFDSNEDGVVDALNVMYAGRTVYEGELWPHNSHHEFTHGGIRTHFYQLSSLGRTRVDLSIGTFCHENGHMLCRFPDMYDYGKRDGDFEKSQGIGVYCLMGSGNHLDGGRTPSPVCGFLRQLVGWADNVRDLNAPGRYTCRHGEYDVVHRFATDKPNEYYIVENRTRRGLDTHLPANGLAVYHCDTLGSNEWQEGVRNRHYQCALVQADGHLDLENNRNPGDAGDLFGKVSAIALSHDTTPSSRQWDGADSGLTLSDITKPGESISFDVGLPTPAAVASGEVTADVLIPDDNQAGITSTIELPLAGVAKAIEVHVEITHTWIGDLQVELLSPSGTAALLHDREGRSSDDLNITYKSASLPALAMLVGEPVDGVWSLIVRDLAGRDVGRLNRWSIRVPYETSDEIVQGEASPNLPIPDADAQGVSSAIVIQKAGRLKDVVVRVDIAHTYVGDLTIELVSPTGQSATIHDRVGGSGNGLRRAYDRRSTPSLAALLETPIEGEWKLRVRDLANYDEGTLEKWELDLTH